MKVFLSIFTIVVMSACFSFAQSGGSISTVVVNGEGKSREDAVAAALEKALLAKCGMTVSISRNSKTMSEESNTDNSVSDSFKHAITTMAKGRIEGFDVAECEKETDGKWNATVSVRIYGQYIVGENPNLRRRMALAPFLSKQRTVSLMGKEYQTSVLLGMLEDSLAEHLTQTRKFTMLDRKYDAEVDTELRRLSAPNAASSDYGRMGQKLGTDYLLCAEVTFFEVPPASTNPYTGITTQANAPLFSVSYRVLLAPTGQLKWADTVKFDVSMAAGRSADEAVSTLFSLAAADISDGLMSNILPFMIADVDNGMIVLNQGGKSLTAGETLTVYTFGKEIKDPVTGESLGRMEVPLGTIKIEKVLPKLSYASVLTGDPAKMIRGCIARRPEVNGGTPDSMSTSEAPGTMFRTTTTGGVLSPFK